MKQCKNCGEEIHPLRIKVVPNTSVCHVCVKDNDVKRKGAVQIITGKTTYSELQIVDEDVAAHVSHLQNRQGGIVSLGVKGIQNSKYLKR